MQKIKKNFREYKKIKEMKKLIFQKTEKKTEKSKSIFNISSNNIFHSNKLSLFSVIMFQNEKKKEFEVFLEYLKNYENIVCNFISYDFSQSPLFVQTNTI